MLRYLTITAALVLISCSAPTAAPEASVVLPQAPTGPASEEPMDRSQLDVSLAPPRPSESPVRPTRLVRTTISGIAVSAVVFDSRTHRLVVADQPRGPGSRWANAESAARSLGGIAAANAGFFTPEGKPLGRVVAGGNIVSPPNRASSLGAGYVLAGPSPALVRADPGGTAPDRIQSGPFLVESGRGIAGLSEASATARTVIGWDGGSGWFLARTGSCSLAALAHALAGGEIGGVRAKTVLNLDGGRSSDLWASSAVQGGPVTERPFWNKPVRNFLVVAPAR